MYTAPILWRQNRKNKFSAQRLTALGKIVSFSVVREPTIFFKAFIPYAIAVVKMNTGQNVIGQITFCDIQNIRVGLKVKVTFRRILAENDKSVLVYGLKFKPL